MGRPPHPTKTQFEPASPPPAPPPSLQSPPPQTRFEPGAVVCRVAPSFVRFGTFQLPVARGPEEIGLVKKVRVCEGVAARGSVDESRLSFGCNSSSKFLFSSHNTLQTSPAGNLLTNPLSQTLQTNASFS